MSTPARSLIHGCIGENVLDEACELDLMACLTVDSTCLWNILPTVASAASDAVFQFDRRGTRLVHRTRTRTNRCSCRSRTCHADHSDITTNIESTYKIVHRGYIGLVLV